ncbi:MAG TPA: NADH-quinone oxidoreductase subunit N [Gemmatimonadaceae bacterium]|nr:NADH-quinone oxidoreductase subunit N [Gemmatimonadaceae bacterium]
MHFDLSVPAQLSAALAPDLVLSVGAMLLLLFAAWKAESEQRARAVGVLSIWLCVITAAIIIWMAVSGASADGGVIAVDNFRWAIDLVILLSTIIALALALDYARTEQLVTAEMYVLVLLSSAGMMLLAAARDLIMVFLAIELMSIAVYVLAGLNRRSSRSAEAALKYFLLGAFSTGFLLYGIALVYGATGTTNLSAIGSHVTEASFSGAPMLLVGIGLLVVGFGFKVALVPFHMWAPDVYEGAPTPITAYMAVAVKAAAFAAFLRVWHEAFPGASGAWLPVLWWLAVITMVVGNIIALAQRNMKRMLAYSSIAHAGYLLVAIVANRYTNAGASSLVFYLVAYTLATMGAFAVVIAVDEPGERRQNLNDYSGLWWERPWASLAMAIFMLSLLGFPIAGGMGFFAKWYILRAAIGSSHPQVSLAVILVIASVISAGYYLAVIIYMFMRPRAAQPVERRPLGLGTSLVIGVSAAALLIFGIFPAGFVGLTSRSQPTVQTAAQASPPIAAAHRQ